MRVSQLAEFPCIPSTSNGCMVIHLLKIGVEIGFFRPRPISGKRWYNVIELIMKIVENNFLLPCAIPSGIIMI